MTATNQAAYLDKAGNALEVRDAPMPKAGSGELIVKNAAVAINPLDWHMADHGVFVSQWPAILGCDVAGEVYEVGPDVATFKRGDRVIGPCDQSRHPPAAIPYTDGAVVPFALEAAVCALSLKEPGVAMPGVATPALALPYPSLEMAPSIGKALVVFGGSSSVGSMTTQIATAAGVHVIAIASSHNHGLCKASGAAEVFDHKDSSLVALVVEAVKASGHEFIGIFDAVAIRETFDIDLEILAQVGGGHLALSHPPLDAVPDNVKVGMIFAVNDIANPVWKDYVMPALASGKLKCLPPSTIVGKGLGSVKEGLQRSKAGVSGTKLVIEL